MSFLRIGQFPERHRGYPVQRLCRILVWEGGKGPLDGMELSLTIPYPPLYRGCRAPRATDSGSVQFRRLDVIEARL